jgi:uncharacterized protein (TIGR02271 family)
MLERSVDWNELVGKEARGKDDTDLGKINAVGQFSIIAQKQAGKETYYLPKFLVKNYDDKTIWLDISDNQLKEFTAEKPPILKNFSEYQRDNDNQEEAVIPAIKEAADISKRRIAEEVTIVKEPIIEYKVVEVPVVRDRIRIIKRPITSELAINNNRDESGEQETKMYLAREELEVRKKRRIFEEVIIRKENVTDKKVVNLNLTRENVYVEGAGEENMLKR